MLTKTAVCLESDGTCKLVEVPFNWQHGDPVPAGAPEQHFATCTEAMTTLIDRGRQQNGAHLEPKKPRPAVAPGQPKPTDEELYLDFIQRATQWRDLPAPPAEPESRTR